ncbi:hypothetical protein VNO77_03411 [Canavalia gladiata]|uniref:Uncharacterized protein n=1 Tax=Canavalia gladiata TaxID=3824 RepID=A0AAN9MZU1_CANGL
MIGPWLTTSVPNMIEGLQVSNPHFTESILHCQRFFSFVLFSRVPENSSTFRACFVFQFSEPLAISTLISVLLLALKSQILRLPEGPEIAVGGGCMAISLSRFSRSLWGGGGKVKEPVSNASDLNSSPSSEWGFGLMKERKVAPPHRKVRRNRREERRVDREYDDFVLVASDEGSDWCLSGSESDDSDWSIGWLEPLSSDFPSVDDDGFAVLVPCYTPGCKEVEASNNVLLTAIKNLSNEFSSAGKDYMGQWLASIQNFEA